MDANREWSIYVLIDPRSNEVRYVGWSSDVRARFGAHLREAKRARTHKERWIAGLLAAGLRPICEVVETGLGEGWADAERRQIADYRAAGARLTNATDGGDGISGYRATPEYRARLSAMRKGRPASPASVEGARRFWTGRKHTADARENMRRAQRAYPRTPKQQAAARALSQYNTGRPMLPQVREAIRQANTGRHPSEETRAKLRAWRRPPLSPEVREGIGAKLRGRKKPPAALEAMRAKLTGRPKSPEHIAQMRERAKRPVRCVDTGIVYPSIAEAAQALGVSIDSIYRSTREGRPRAGLRWERVEDK